MSKRSAGLLLHRTRGAGIEVLLVHPGGPFWAARDAGAWSLPKGEYDSGEDPLQAALREFREELGTAAPVAVDELVDLGTVVQAGGKVVRVWSAEADVDAAEITSVTFELEWPPKSGQVREFPEVDRAEWFTVEVARSKLVPAQVEFLDRLAAHLG